MTRAAALLLVCSSLRADSVIQEFQARVADYMKLRGRLKPESKPLRPTDSSEKIADREQKLAKRIREARRDAVQGAIFTPAIAAEFRRLIGITMGGSDAAAIRASLRRAEPVQLNQLSVNRPYPHAVPRQSTPPSLLLNLPPLPKELQYLVVGNALVLLDTGANLIVDFIPGAIGTGP